MNVLTIQAKKERQEKITMLTCYDAGFARLLDQTALDMILVGDSVAMVAHGYDNTIPATLAMMQMHTRMVAPQVKRSLLVTDMPFLSYQQGLTQTMANVQSLVQAGAEALKIEGASPSILRAIQHIVEAGVPVIGHIGLRLQAQHQQGGFKVQGKTVQAAKQLLDEALKLQEVGCFALLLECIPPEVAAEITEHVVIPTIGIGAGPDTDGQVLVLYDMLGLEQRFKAKFVKHYLSGADLVTKAVNQYIQEVTLGKYPSKDHCY